jgi:hypothetical protein
MSTLIYNVTENFAFNNLKVENPSLINANNYFSKIYNNNNKNFYVKLPKCKTKQGIVNSNNKCFCELEFNSNEKLVAEFFENLEEFCIQEICNNKSLWFYDSDNITSEDIQEYITPIMRSYKGGKKFLIKTNIKQDKLIIYDENEKKIVIDEYDKENEIVPLININGVKFSKSSFIIDILLVQFMILYPCDSFENQILIKINKPINKLEYSKADLETNNISTANHNSNNKYDDTSSVNDESNDDYDNLEETSCINEKLLFSTNNDKIKDIVEPDSLEPDSLEPDSLEPDSLEPDSLEPDSLESDSLEPNSLEPNSLEPISLEPSSLEPNSLEPSSLESDSLIEVCDLDNIILDSEPIEIKTHDSIYLEIYKKAKQKAKEIRKNAIQAFLEAKNIKIAYNLNTINDSSSDEEYKD